MHTQAPFSTKNYMDHEGLANHASHSSLFLHVSSGSLCMVAASKGNDQVLGMRIVEIKDSDLFRQSPSEIRAALDALQWNQHEYSDYKIIVESNGHALVPDALFAGDKAASFLKLNTAVGKQHQVFFNRMQKNMVSVFALHEPFYQTLRGAFPEAEIIHETALLLAMMSSAPQREEKDHLFVHVHDTYIEIAQVKQQELNYLNTFQVEADTDVIYFILSVAELLKLNQDKLHVSLFGKVSSSGSLVGLMKKYVTQVDLLKRPSQFAYPASFREFADQQYYLQTCSLFCAS